MPDPSRAPDALDPPLYPSHFTAETPLATVPPAGKTLPIEGLPPGRPKDPEPVTITSSLIPCPLCKRPMDARKRCWVCCNRLCEACGRLTGTAFISVCRLCEVAAELQNKRPPAS